MTTLSRASTQVVLRRCVQWTIDLLMVMVVALTLAAVATVLAVWLGLEGRPILHFAIGAYIAAAIVASALNEVVLPTRTGATVGMEVTGLRVVTLQGTRPTIGRYVVRHLLWVVDGLFWGAAALAVMVFTPYHQRVGDLVAGTVVVRKPSADEPVLPGPDRELRPVAQPELALGAGQMRLDG
ncbi:RDD family protein [Kribbella flavida]|uniref:RDD family protein n=1 Tax=Kribbella flavida TaxID=182640 RepID=UPI00019BE3C0|nr:RDD family protein [Kribbella flavida]